MKSINKLLILSILVVTSVVFFISCTADTVNINGTYEETKRKDTRLEFKREKGRNVSGYYWGKITTDETGKAIAPYWKKFSDVKYNGILKGISNIKLELTAIEINDGKTTKQTATYDVLDFGNTLKSGSWILKKIKK